MDCVSIEHAADGISVVTLDRPPVNAFDLEFARKIGAVLDAELAEAPLGLVLTGAGSCFSAGVDTKAAPSYSPEKQAEMVRAINAMLRSLYSCSLPTVCALNGHALGGGLVAPLACDYRVATSADCRLGLPEVTAGVPYPAVAMRIVQAELDPAAARVLVLTGRVVTPQQGLELGIVDELCKPERLLDRAIDVARRHAALPAYERVKAQLRAGAIADMDETVEHERDPMIASWIG